MTSSTSNIPSETPKQTEKNEESRSEESLEETLNEEGRKEESEADMESRVESVHVISVEEEPQDSDGEEKEADEYEKSSAVTVNGEWHPDVHSGDLGRVIHLKAHRDLTTNEKYFLLKHHFVPNKDYHFPTRVINDRQRHFQYSWQEKYAGLVYSKSEDGGYCKYCVLFGRCESSVKELGVLVTRPLTNFKKASEKLVEHFTKSRKSHQNAMEKAMTFIAVTEKQALSIDQQLNTEISKRIAENRTKLQSIAATVVFCRRQGIALRGHRDDGPVAPTETTVIHGNFQALLQFRIDSGDAVLKEHLQTASRNAMYTSKEIQNEMIGVCGDIIRNKILQRIRKAQFFSVIADEATDTANDEQLSISIRFVENGQPLEKFLGFHECKSGVTGEAIAKDILANSLHGSWQGYLSSRASI